MYVYATYVHIYVRMQVCTSGCYTHICVYNCVQIGTLVPVVSNPGAITLLSKVASKQVVTGNGGWVGILLLPSPTLAPSASVSAIREQAVLMASESAQWAQVLPQGTLCLTTAGHGFIVSTESCPSLMACSGLC